MPRMPPRLLHRDQDVSLAVQGRCNATEGREGEGCIILGRAKTSKGQSKIDQQVKCRRGRTYIQTTHTVGHNCIPCCFCARTSGPPAYNSLGLIAQPGTKNTEFSDTVHKHQGRQKGTKVQVIALLDFSAQLLQDDRYPKHSSM